MIVENVYIEMIEGKPGEKVDVQSAKESPKIVGQESEEMKIVDNLVTEQTAP